MATTTITEETRTIGEDEGAALVDEIAPGMAAARDAPGFFAGQVRMAVSLGLAPICEQAIEPLRALYQAAGAPLPPEATVGGWLLALVGDELARQRVRALWPHPAGTRVVHREGGLERTTRTASAAVQSGDMVLVNLEGYLGAADVLNLQVLT